MKFGNKKFYCLLADTAHGQISVNGLVAIMSGNVVFARLFKVIGLISPLRVTIQSRHDVVIAVFDFKLRIGWCLKADGRIPGLV